MPSRSPASETTSIREAEPGERRAEHDRARHDHVGTPGFEAGQSRALGERQRGEPAGQALDGADTEPVALHAPRIVCREAKVECGQGRGRAGGRDEPSGTV